MVYKHSIDLFCTETEESLPAPGSPHSTVSLTPTEKWALSDDERLELADYLNSLPENVPVDNENSDDEIVWKGRSEPKQQPFTAYANDTIFIDPEYRCHVSYRCCICDDSHDHVEVLEPGKFDPTSVSFKLGPPPTLSIHAPCASPCSHPVNIELSFHRWQMRGAHAVFASPPRDEYLTTAAAPVMTTPPCRKRRADEEPGAPPRAPGHSFVSDSTADVRGRLTARYGQE